MKKNILAIFFCAVVLLAALTAGCSSAGPSAARSGAAQKNAAVQDSAGKVGAAETTGNGSEDKTDGGDKTAAAQSARKVVKTAGLSIETLDYGKSTAGFEKSVAEFGGYIENSSVQGTGQGSGASRRTASYTARIPAERLEEFLDRAGSVGTIVSRSTGGEDVTQNYYDTDTRVKSLETERDRLLDLMKKADKMADVLAIEQRLTEVQTQIEQLTGDLKRMDSLVSLATVTVSIQEVAAITEPAAQGFGGQISAVFRSSLNAFARTSRTVFLALVAVLPFAAAAAAVVGIILLIRRRRKGKKP